MPNMTEVLITRWEDQREIKNLMGKYANCLILNREGDMFELLWSTRPDVSLVLNDGAYVGEAVRAYYVACAERTALVSSLLKKRFPEETKDLPEGVANIGPFKVRPLASPVIEIAGDGDTAKGLWYCQGTYSEVEACGPVAHWTWGYFAVDFVKECDGWRIWHLQYLNDIDSLCGQSWLREAEPYPVLEEFAVLDEFQYPPYTVKKDFRPYYSPTRPTIECPSIPEPYGTFEETFSYGVEEV